MVDWVNRKVMREEKVEDGELWEEGERVGGGNGEVKREVEELIWEIEEKVEREVERGEKEIVGMGEK